MDAHVSVLLFDTSLRTSGYLTNQAKISKFVGR